MKLITLILLMLVSGISIAGNQTGSIEKLIVSGRDYIPPFQNPTHVHMSGAYSDKPACSTSGYWAIDTESEQGKVILTMLLTAYATKQNVTLWGTGKCSLRPDMETVFQAGVGD